MFIRKVILYAPIEAGPEFRQCMHVEQNWCGRRDTSGRRSYLLEERVDPLAPYRTGDRFDGFDLPSQSLVLHNRSYDRGADRQLLQHGQGDRL